MECLEFLLYIYIHECVLMTQLTKTILCMCKYQKNYKCMYSPTNTE